MRLYRALLHCYPKAFRREYGRQMEAVVMARRRSVAGPAVVRFWAAAVVDVLVNAARVHGDILRQDVRHAFRTLSRTPGFTATAIVVAALGTGATTIAFSVADHVLVRPLPFRDASRLVMVWQDQSSRGYSRIELSVGNYLDLKARNTSLDGFAAYTSAPVNLVGEGTPQRLDAAVVTPDLFTVLGVQAALGRTMVTADAQPDAQDTVVLSDRLWRMTFGGDAGVLGRRVLLDGRPHLVIGVMPRGFGFPTREIDLWLPFRMVPDEDRANLYLRTVARVRDGVSIDQARSELRAIAAQLEREYPVANAETSASVIPLRDQVTAQTRMLLVTLVAASLCLLSVACLNLENLLLARALARQQELAIRAALGAGWERLVRQIVTESVMLAAAGGAAGVVLALLFTPLVASLVPTTMPIPDTPGADWRMLSIAALITMGTALGFGIAPALRVRRPASTAALRDRARSGTSRATERWRAALIVTEVAATVVLLVGAGLLLRALWRVQEIDPGFEPDQVLTARTALPLPQYEATERRQQFYDRVIDGLQAVPGVTSAAYTSFLPMVMRGGIWPVKLGGPNAPEAGTVSLRLITPGYFRTMDIPLLAGRDVAAGDTMQTSMVAVVSASFARQYWPDRDAIGRQMFIAFNQRTVVGVVGDVRVRGLERDSEPQVYLPARQVPDGALAFYAPKDLVIRSSVPPVTLVDSLRRIVAAADPEQPVSDVRLLADVVADDTAARRTQVTVLGGFAAIAFLLAAVGLHGLLSFTVSRQTRDIGVRIALGAAPHRIFGMVVGRGFALAGIGAMAGLVGALGAGRLLASQLAGVSAADPTVFAAAIALALFVAIAGSLAPTRRAVRIDPVAALRME